VAVRAGRVVVAPLVLSLAVLVAFVEEDRLARGVLKTPMTFETTTTEMRIEDFIIKKKLG
jgi:hypothetical protein